MEASIASFIGAEPDKSYIVSEKDAKAVDDIITWASTYKSTESNIYLHIMVDKGYPYIRDRILHVNSNIIDQLMIKEKELTKGNNIVFDIIIITNEMEKNFNVQITKKITLCGIHKSYLTTSQKSFHTSIRGISDDGRICP